MEVKQKVSVELFHRGRLERCWMTKQVSYYEGEGR